MSTDVKRKMTGIEKKLEQIHKRGSRVLGGINYFLVKHTLNRPAALGYAVELRRVADELEQLIRGLDDKH
jgi:hypothetical protein